MTISYPLSLPNESHIMEMAMSEISGVYTSKSPLSHAQQAVFYQGSQLWLCEVTLTPLNESEAKDWLGFFSQLKGSYGYFHMGHPLHNTPRGSWAGSTIRVNGANQEGAELSIDGGNASETGFAKAGDFIQLGSGSTQRLYKVLQDADTNASGEVTLDIFPDLREAPTDNQVITTSDAKGTWRMISSPLDTGYRSDSNGIFKFKFQAMEYLNG